MAALHRVMARSQGKCLPVLDKSKVKSAQEAERLHVGMRRTVSLFLRCVWLTCLLAFAQRRAAVAAFWRALAVRLKKAIELGRDVGLAESGFAHQPGRLASSSIGLRLRLLS